MFYNSLYKLRFLDVLVSLAFRWWVSDSFEAPHLRGKGEFFLGGFHDLLLVKIWASKWVGDLWWCFSGRWIFARPLTFLWAKSQKPTRREEMWFFVRHINLPKPKRFYQQAKHQLWPKLFCWSVVGHSVMMSANRLCPRCSG